MNYCYKNKNYGTIEGTIWHGTRIEVLMSCHIESAISHVINTTTSVKKQEIIGVILDILGKIEKYGKGNKRS